MTYRFNLLTSLDLSTLAARNVHKLPQSVQQVSMYFQTLCKLRLASLGCQLAQLEQFQFRSFLNWKIGIEKRNIQWHYSTHLVTVGNVDWDARVGNVADDALAPRNGDLFLLGNLLYRRLAGDVKEMTGEVSKLKINEREKFFIERAFNLKVS